MRLERYTNFLDGPPLRALIFAQLKGFNLWSGEPHIFDLPAKSD